MAHIIIFENWIEGHGRELPAALRAEGHSWTFLTRRPEHYTVDGAVHPIMSEAVSVEITETNSFEKAQSAVQRLVDVTGATGLFTVCDYYIPQVYRISKSLGLPSAYGPASVTTRDKAATRALLDLASISNPDYLVTGDVDAALTFARAQGFPVVCKPSDLASSALVRRVDTELELREAFAAIVAMRHNFRGQPRSSTVLIEEWLDGPEFSVEAVTAAGRTHVLGITDKVLAGEPYFVEIGHQFPAQLQPADRATIDEFVHRCLAAVGFTHGVSHTEVKLTSSGPRLVEINPRPGGNYIVDLVRLVTGIDLLRLQLAQSLGQDYVSIDERRVASAASAMLIPDRAGRITCLHGVEEAKTMSDVERFETFIHPPADVDAPTDNSCYLGVAIATDATGLNAGRRAREVAATVRPVYETTSMVTPS